MKKIPFVLMMALIALLVSTYAGSATSDVKDKETVQARQNVDQEALKKFKGMDRSYSGPLPWEKDQEFIKILAENEGLKRMVAYKAVLPDPIGSERYNISLAADQLAGTIVKPGETFSQNNTLGPYIEQQGYQSGPTYSGTQMITTVGGGVCKIASVLYNVVTFCDLPVIMRSNHSMTVPYVPPGQDATVYYGVKDFRFLNDTEGPILIWSKNIEGTLYIALYGVKNPPEVVWHHKTLKKIDYWTETKYNADLKPGEERVVMPGSEGLVVQSWVTITTTDGQQITKQRGKSYYNPSPRIIERGPRITQ